MKIRPARIEDCEAICRLVNHYAELGKMLHRSLESVYGEVREFHVAENNGKIIGCVAVDVSWADLAEVKSLVVSPQHTRQGIGHKLMDAAIADARRLGVSRVFALTYEIDFFRHWGFEQIDRATLPDKVWRECIACPKVDACDETAMLLKMGGE